MELFEKLNLKQLSILCNVFVNVVVLGIALDPVANTIKPAPTATRIIATSHLFNQGHTSTTLKTLLYLIQHKYRYIYTYGGI